MFDWAEALERLRSPYALEDLSPLAGCPLFVVDLTRGMDALDEAALQPLRSALAQLACPSVALCPGPARGAAAELLPRFDVVIESDEALLPLAESARRTPLAAQALVQLLRHSEGLAVHEALIAESLVYSVLQSGPEFRAWLDARERREAAAEPDEPAVFCARKGARLGVWLNRPHKRNAFSVAMRDGLVDALRIAVADDSVSELIVRGRGAAFCSGGDLDEFGSLPDPGTAHAVRSTRNPARLLAACAAKARFEVHGACVGAGAELPAFARRVVASEDAFFLLPEVAMGLVPGAGGTVSLPRRIGRQRTAWLALSAARLDAATAEQWGLVDEVRLLRESDR